MDNKYIMAFQNVMDQMRNDGYSGEEIYSEFEFSFDEWIVENGMEEYESEDD